MPVFYVTAMVRRDVGIPEVKPLQQVFLPAQQWKYINCDSYSNSWDVHFIPFMDITVLHDRVWRTMLCVPLLDPQFAVVQRRHIRTLTCRTCTIPWILLIYIIVVCIGHYGSLQTFNL